MWSRLWRNVFKGMCPVYINDLFEINSVSSSKRLNMLLNLLMIQDKEVIV